MLRTTRYCKVMLDTLGGEVHDNRLLRLIGRDPLAARYLEDKVWNATLSGVPQGGVLSQCLSFVSLEAIRRQFVETMLMPEYDRGVLRKPNPEYRGCSRRPLVLAIVAMMCEASYASGNAVSPASIRMIPATGGCGT